MFMIKGPLTALELTILNKIIIYLTFNYEILVLFNIYAVNKIKYYFISLPSENK